MATNTFSEEVSDGLEDVDREFNRLVREQGTGFIRHEVGETVYALEYEGKSDKPKFIDGEEKSGLDMADEKIGDVYVFYQGIEGGFEKMEEDLRKQYLKRLTSL